MTIQSVSGMDISMLVITSQQVSHSQDSFGHPHSSISLVFSEVVERGIISSVLFLIGQTCNGFFNEALVQLTLLAA